MSENQQGESKKKMKQKKTRTPIQGHWEVTPGKRVRKRLMESLSLAQKGFDQQNLQRRENLSQLEKARGSSQDRSQDPTLPNQAQGRSKSQRRVRGRVLWRRRVQPKIQSRIQSRVESKRWSWIQVSNSGPNPNQSPRYDSSQVIWLILNYSINWINFLTQYTIIYQWMLWYTQLLTCELSWVNYIQISFGTISPLFSSTFLLFLSLFFLPVPRHLAQLRSLFHLRK